MNNTGIGTHSEVFLREDIAAILDALNQFTAYVYDRFAIRHLWLVTPEHAQAWLDALVATHAPSTAADTGITYLHRVSICLHRKDRRDLDTCPALLIHKSGREIPIP